MSQLTQFMPPPEIYKSEIGSQSTMCQVQAGAYVSLLTPGETKYSDCRPSKTTTYILHVVSITSHTHDRHKSIGEKETKKRKEDMCGWVSNLGLILVVGGGNVGGVVRTNPFEVFLRVRY